jgi:hypothetical protein
MAQRSNKPRPVRVIEDSAKYLVRLDSTPLFYSRTSGDGMPLGVRAPSAALHGSYVDADRICQEFRAKGFTGPVVTDIFGSIIDHQALEEERRAQRESENRFWGE